MNLSVTFEKYGGPYLPYVCQDGRGCSPNLGILTNKKNPNEIRIFMTEKHEYIQTNDTSLDETRTKFASYINIEVHYY